MGYIDINGYVGQFEFNVFGSRVPKGDFARLLFCL